LTDPGFASGVTDPYTAVLILQLTISGMLLVHAVDVVVGMKVNKTTGIHMDLGYCLSKLPTENMIDFGRLLVVDLLYNATN